MRFNDTAPTLPSVSRPPPWLDKLADNATMEAAVLNRPVEGRSEYSGAAETAIPLYSTRTSPIETTSATDSSWSLTERRFAACRSNARSSCI